MQNQEFWLGKNLPKLEPSQTVMSSDWYAKVNNPE